MQMPMRSLLFAAIGMIAAVFALADELPKLPQPGEGFPKLPAPEVEPAERQNEAIAQLRQQIAKKLGAAEDGNFILVFSKGVPATRPANGVLPPGARRLPNNRWLEVIYQVEMTAGREAAIDMVLLFLKHVETYPGANYDWGLVARVDDAQAEQTLEAAHVKYARASVTLRPRTAESLKFFNRTQRQFFNGLQLKP